MNEQYQAPILSGTELQTVLTALSLDCGRPFWASTGLSVNEGDAKAILSEARAALMNFEEGTDSPYEADYSPDRARAVGDAFSFGLSKSVSGEAVEQVMQWAQRLLQARAERDWYQGLLTCLALMNDPARGYGTLMLNKPDRDSALQLITEALRDPSDEELVRRSQEDQSEFDRKMLVRSQTVGLITNSLRQLLLRVRYEQLLGKVQATLSAHGTRVFSAWLEDQIKTLNMRADRR